MRGRGINSMQWIEREEWRRKIKLLVAQRDVQALKL